MPTDPKKQAQEVVAALNEVRAAYNNAKSAGQKSARVSVRALYLLTVGASRGYDVPLHAADGSLIYDPRTERTHPDPRKN